MAAKIWSAPLVAALLLACTAASAGDLYQWKDAHGVTHYADAPPPKGAYKARTVEIRDGAAAAAPADAVGPKPANPTQCALAHTNLDRLQAGGNIGLDANGDGKPDAPMSATERAKQLELAQRQIHVFCNAKAAATGT
jgi:hypothetical protein